MRSLSIVAFGLFCLTLGLPLGAAPIPLEDVSNVVSFAYRGGYQVSPDGKWIAYIVELPDSQKKFGAFIKSGAKVVNSERRQARLKNLETGQVLYPGGEEAFSWGPMWSPDGTRLALFTDEQGKVALKIWDLKTKKGTLFPQIIPRIEYYFQNLQWHPNGRSIAALTLPVDELMLPSADRSNVQVFRSREESEEPTSWSYACLSLLDLETGDVKVLTDKRYFRYFAFSPDGKMLANSHYVKTRESMGVQEYAISVVDLNSKRERLLSSDRPLRYGIEWS